MFYQSKHIGLKCSECRSKENKINNRIKVAGLFQSCDSSQFVPFFDLTISGFSDHFIWLVENFRRKLSVSAFAY